MNKSSLVKYKRIMTSLMILILFAIVAFKVVDNIDAIFKGIGIFFSAIWKVIMPFALGAFIAFILHSAVNFIEIDFANLFTKGRPNKVIRCVSVTIVYVIAISLICLAGVYLVPAIQESIIEFKNNLPANIDKAQTLLQSTGLDLDFKINDVNFGEEITKAITDFITKEGAVINLLGNIADFTSALINGLLGIIISFYILVDKENLGAYIKKVILSFVDKVKADKFFDFCNNVTKTFDKFIVGKVIDSIIIGMLSYIGFLILGIKYRLIFAVIIGLTNIIPYVGPFMGAIPVGILVFLYKPALTIPVLIFIFALQQFDGSILGPKVLGDAIGVKPIAVIFAILVGGAIGGILGMFLAVPTYVVIADLVNKYIDEHYKKKCVDKEGGKNE
ncbi:MAG: AI-2E family transporter [Clostridia bacterium]|nr:AI-2E family transporter [Clostridia bacterium]